MAKPDSKADGSNPNNVQLLQNLIGKIDSDKAKLKALLVSAEDHQAKIRDVIAVMKKK